MSILGGIANATGKVVMEYRADTSQARAEIKKLSGEQKKAAQEALDAQEKHNKSLGDFVTKLGMAAGAAATVYTIGKAGFEEYTKAAQLSAATASISVAALRKAAGGLRDDMRLQEFAVAGMTGKWKLNQEQLGRVLEGWRALRKDGKDTEKTYEALKKAIERGSVEPLKEAGIAFDETLAKTDQLAALMKVLGDATNRAGGNLSLAGDDMTQLGVKWNNALSSVKIGIGELVVSLTPLLQGLAAGVDLIGQINNATGGIPGAALGRVAKYSIPVYGQVLAGRDAFNALTDDGEAAGDWAYRIDRQRGSVYRAKARRREASVGAAAGDRIEAINAKLRAQTEAQTRGMRGRRRGGGGGAGWGTDFGGEYRPEGTQGRLGGALDRLGGMGGDLYDSARANDLKYSGISADDAKRFGGALQGQFEDETKDAKNARLEQIFGPIKDFDAYQSAFEGLSGAVTSGFDAWITGSKGVGQALKEALAGYAKNLAIESALRALQEGAHAIAAAASYNYPKAALHAAAAAKWTAVAIAAGVVAKTTGGGGGASPGGAGGYRPSSQDHSYMGNSRTVVIGDHTSDSSPRRRARETRRLNDTADKYAPPTGSRHGQ